jgi:Zn-dependent protease with chaperone function
MKIISAAKTITSTLYQRFQGFAFSTNRWIFLSVLASALLYGVVDLFSLKLFFGLMLAVACGLAMIPLTECVTSFSKNIKELKRIYGARKTYSFGLIEEFLNLAKAMGVHLRGQDTLKIVPCWVNAAACLDGRIILGQAIAEQFDKEDRQALLAHELAHLKARHPLKNASVLLLVFVAVVFAIPFLHLPGLVNLLLVFSAYGLILPAVSWRLEYEADAIAARFVGRQPVTIALGKLAEANNIDVQRDTYLHPSVRKRISRLQNLGR